MRLPKQVKVGGHSIKIEPSTFDEIKGYAAYSRANNWIKVAKDVDQDQMSSSLLHEVLHAAIAEGGLSEVLGRSEEKVVMALELVLFQVLKDNPKVVKFIIGEKRRHE
jgi:hypothetical protein